MVDRWIWRILLLPLALLYGIGVAIKNLLYRLEMLRGVRFDIPVISVGNLNVGGSGKTPHVEYLIRVLSPYLHVATLSRGYKRKSAGFLVVKPQMKSEVTGDEPLMYARKYPHIAVAVSESRALGIPKLLQQFPPLRAVILDDAFQHRAVTPSLNILLTQYGNAYYEDWLLPSGSLREFRSGARRADYIIVTKCPDDFSEADREKALGKIRPNALQHVFFSRYRYGTPYNMFNGTDRRPISADDHVLAICGIARTDYLEQYLAGEASSARLLEFGDHHPYGPGDIEMIKKHVATMPEQGRMIVTTEKDAVRLEKHAAAIRDAGLNIWVLPIQVQFLFDGEERINALLREFLLNFKF